MGPASYFGSGAKPKWPKPEAHRAESGVFGEGEPALFRQLGDLGSAGAETRPLKGFLAFYRRQVASPGISWGQVRGTMPPLNPPMDVEVLFAEFRGCSQHCHVSTFRMQIGD